MTDLTEFLLARIAEDESVAKAAYDHDSWSVVEDGNGDPWVVQTDVTGQKWRVAMVPEVPATHIARHDPARVLAECEAKRELIKISDFYETDTGTEIPRALASVYADHPDYLDEWKPGTGEDDEDMTKEGITNDWVDDWLATMEQLPISTEVHLKLHTGGMTEADEIRAKMAEVETLQAEMKVLRARIAAQQAENDAAIEALGKRIQQLSTDR